MNVEMYQIGDTEVTVAERALHIVNGSLLLYTESMIANRQQNTPWEKITGWVGGVGGKMILHECQSICLNSNSCW